MIKTASSLDETGIDKSSRILIVFAHPDDESVFAAGFIQQALTHGSTLRLLTLTHGEAGSTRHGLSPYDNLGIVRSRELQNACHILGSCSFQICDFPDSGLADRINEIQQMLTAEIKNFQPGHLLGFAPDGINGHFDHKAASRAILQLHWADPSQFQIILATGHHNHSRPAKRGVELALKLSLGQCQTKIRALEAHRSQFTSRGIRSWFDSDQMDTEHFFLPA